MMGVLLLILAFSVGHLVWVVFVVWCLLLVGRVVRHVGGRQPPS
ncbi:MAG: hypothetical protein ACK4PI_03045 [Tepidisphaerales bacterium]